MATLSLPEYEGLDAIGLVPMHPHTLSSRPIVVSGDSEIKIQVLSDIPPRVSADGQPGQMLEAGDWVYVRKHPFKLRLLHPPGTLTIAQIEDAVVDVARFNVFKLSEAVLSGQIERTLRMIDGLQAEGEAAVLVHWALTEDILGLYRARTALDGGKPLPMVLREQRVWGPRERLFERILPHTRAAALARLVAHASTVDGIVKGLRHPQWPQDGWEALRRLALELAQTAQGQPVGRVPAATRR